MMTHILQKNSRDENLPISYLPDWQRVFVVEFIGNKWYAKLVPSGALFLKLTLNDLYFDFVAQVVLDLTCREL